MTARVVWKCNAHACCSAWSAPQRTAILTATGACFAHDHFRKQRQRRREAIPNPNREHLAGGILESGNLIEAAMVERIMDRRDRLFDVAVIDEKSPRRIDIAFDHNIDTKRMSVHASALVAIGKAREEVSGFEGEALGKSNAHR